VGHRLGPEGNGVSSGEGGEGGPGPPSKDGEKQSTPSKEGGNMEQEEERSKRLFNNVIKFTLMMLNLILRLFQENKSDGVEPICIHPLMSRYCTSLRHVWHINDQKF
jgi:hypothetical protein